MTITLQSKLPSVGTTIFTVMSRLAAELGAINLSQGFPDFDCDPALVDAVARHMREGRNQYAPMQGVLPLREAIAAKYEHFHGRRYDPDTEVTVTSGGTEAIFDAVAAVVHPGDEAIVLEPCYDSYVPAIELSGGVPVVVPLTYPDYAIDWDAVRAAVTPKTRLLIINSPHNPAGAVLTPSDIRELTALVDGTDIVIISDEVYEHIIFDGAAAREHGAPSRARRAQLHRRLLRQDVSRDGLEGRLRRRAGGADGGVPEGAPVRHLLDEHAGAVRARGLPVLEARPRGAVAVLPGQARPVPAADGGVAVHAAPEPRQLLPVDGLFGDHRRRRTRTSRCG